MGFCIECNDKRMCNRFNIRNNENKEFEPYLYLLKRQDPDEFGHMLPCFKE